MVSFKSKFDSKYLSDGLKAHIKVRLKPIKYAPLVSVVYLIFLVAMSLLGNLTFSLTLTEIIIIIMLILFPFIFYYTNSFNFKNNSLFGKELNWDINSELIKGFNDNLIFIVNWKDILEAYKLKNGLIIYKNKNSYYWFPNDDLDKENLVNDILGFIKTNNIKYSIKN